MIKTHLILDGLQDPKLGRELSARWASAGFENEVDVAGQAGWVAKPQAALTEEEVDRAAAIARIVGLEVRDRVGSVFQAGNDLAALRERIAYEYKSRFATALVYGLPAIALHYMGRILAGGEREPRSMIYPWLFEMILVGWACVAAAWPILWQGALSLINLRATGDLLTSAIMLLTFIPSVFGVLSLMFTERPKFPGGSPLFYATIFTVLLAVLQRWLAHRAAARLSGRALLLLNGFGRLIALWVMVSVAVMVLAGWRMGLATALLMPPMMSLGAINRWSPGWSVVLPVFAFAVVLLMGPRAMGRSVGGVEIEIAAGFQAIMVLVMAVGWRGWGEAEDAASRGAK